MKNVHESILDCIGNTPMVRLRKVTAGLKCTVYAKVEFFNPAGSIKDRVAKQIVEDYEAEGVLKEGGMLVEGTSGNTGAGLALMAADRGYSATFVMPDKQSEEKRAALRAWGAKVVITPTDVAAEDPRSYYKVSERLVRENENACYANQYHNPSNPKAHYLSTGPEIWDQLDGKIDVFFAGVGTGGTISGTGAFLKEQNKDVQVVGIDPVGSLFYDYFHSGVMTKPYTYVLEGIGEDFLPTTVDFSSVDDIIRVNDKECFEMTRRLVREEGIFAGASCGAAVAGALKYLQRHDREGMVAVIILPDSGKNYLSKVFNDRWMEENRFLEPDTNTGTVADLIKHKGKGALVKIEAKTKVSNAISILKDGGISQAPVMKGNKLLGILSEKTLLHRALQGDPRQEKIESLIDLDFCVVHGDTEIVVLTELFARYKVALLFEGKEGPKDIITRIDLIDYMASQKRRK
ncbi:MAG: pyridoxal-5'-phosphate-dependent protein subunit beta [Proteobacteria bacterium]|nr:pyridoxal-5'-phosphate-dependent protein subunit beta [Pseudomonadota bacterium]